MKKPIGFSNQVGLSPLDPNPLSESFLIGGFLQLIEIPNYSSEMVDPPKPLLEMNRVVASLLGYSSSFRQDTWSMDPIVLSELEQAADIKAGAKLWKDVIHGRVTTPITGWPSGEQPSDVYMSSLR
jgi:hypothetical protein